MAQFWGPIGIRRTPKNPSPGIIETVIDEVVVRGELRNVQASWSQQSMNDTVRARHVLSVVTPEKSTIDFNAVVYVVWFNQKWTVTSIQYKRPRVELTLGGLYNG